MRELTKTEIDAVGGAVAPLVVIGIDLALNGLVLGLATWATMNNHAQRQTSQ